MGEMENLDQAKAILEKAIADGVVEQRAGWLKFGDINLGQGMDKVTLSLAQDDDLRATLGEAVGVEVVKSAPAVTAPIAAPAKAAPKKGYPVGTCDVNLDEIGVREMGYNQNLPVETETVEGRKIMDIQTVQRKFRLPQPLLTLEEAEKLGRQKWHPFRGDPSVMTCKIRQGRGIRRFMVSNEVYQQLDKD